MYTTYLVIFTSLLIMHTIVDCFVSTNQNDALMDWHLNDINDDNYEYHGNRVYLMKMPLQFSQTSQQSSSSLPPSPPASSLSSYWSYYFTDGEPKRNGHYSQRLGK
ncbi:hypothetical protein MN116_007637 [Schistosoma mekongi]|uniref:Uncharacterized protein n=1 Tax=Schistosoma mekongi TaxID=38744 RepID=A0AAE2D2Z3_SCHME|nr:hypothetical protein MN116_007637 [Schistosoma mekongi]